MGIVVEMVNNQPADYEEFSEMYEKGIDSSVGQECLTMGYAALYWIRRDIAEKFGIEITQSNDVLGGDHYHWENNPMGIAEEDEDILWEFLLLPDTEALLDNDSCKVLNNLFKGLHIEHFDDYFQTFKKIIKKASTHDYQVIWS